MPLFGSLMGKNVKYKGFGGTMSFTITPESTGVKDQHGLDNFEQHKTVGTGTNPLNVGILGVSSFLSDAYKSLEDGGIGFQINYDYVLRNVESLSYFNEGTNVVNTLKTSTEGAPWDFVFDDSMLPVDGETITQNIVVSLDSFSHTEFYNSDVDTAYNTIYPSGQSGGMITDPSTYPAPPEEFEPYLMLYVDSDNANEGNQISLMYAGLNHTPSADTVETFSYVKMSTILSNYDKNEYDFIVRINNSTAIDSCVLSNVEIVYTFEIAGYYFYCCNIVNKGRDSKFCYSKDVEYPSKPENNELGGVSYDPTLYVRKGTSISDEDWANCKLYLVSSDGTLGDAISMTSSVYEVKLEDLGITSEGYSFVLVTDLDADNNYVSNATWVSLDSSQIAFSVEKRAWNTEIIVGNLGSRNKMWSADDTKLMWSEDEDTLMWLPEVES